MPPSRVASGSMSHPSATADAPSFSMSHSAAAKTSQLMTPFLSALKLARKAAMPSGEASSP